MIFLKEVNQMLIRMEKHLVPKGFTYSDSTTRCDECDIKFESNEELCLPQTVDLYLSKDNLFQI